jgi:hypothetical protein
MASVRVSLNLIEELVFRDAQVQVHRVLNFDNANGWIEFQVEGEGIPEGKGEPITPTITKQPELKWDWGA